jgi:hypothetical protein
MTVRDVYLLTLHEPYDLPGHPVPIDATVVHASTLLHPALLQPDGGMIYRCLTEFPDRGPGCVVPISTLTFELAGGELWPYVGDWEQVVDGVVRVSRARECDAMPIGLPAVGASLLAQGPTTTLTLHFTDGGEQVVGGRERQQELDRITGYVRQLATQGAFWPGDGLVSPPPKPAVLPYSPLRSR